jgi:nucleoid-associated protein YgaU
LPRTGWREIYELNKDVIGKNPDLIQPGMELNLPD